MEKNLGHYKTIINLVAIQTSVRAAYMHQGLQSYEQMNIHDE
jgi:hypothetical protein